MPIAAIPTMYEGVQMRSRLEACWAAMFDLLGWEWAYEPPAYDQNGWIPDFVLNGERPILVEVKPTRALPPEVCRKIVNAKANGPHELTEVLILGESPFVASVDDPPGVSFGWLQDTVWIAKDQVLLMDDTDWDIRWGDAVIGTANEKKAWDFCHSRHSYSERMTRFELDGWAHGEVPEAIRDLWKKACNEIQWKKVGDERTKGKALVDMLNRRVDPKPDLYRLGFHGTLPSPMSKQDKRAHKSGPSTSPVPGHHRVSVDLSAEAQ